MLTVNAHDADVNVLSWNRQTTFMMASGADDGSLRAWDLRSFTDGGYVANFSYHRYVVCHLARTCVTCCASVDLCVSVRICIYICMPITGGQ